MDEEKKDSSRRGKKAVRVILIIIVVLLALVLLAVSVGMLIVNSTLNKISRATEPSFTLSQEEIDAIENGVDDDYEDATASPDETVDPTAETTEPPTLPSVEISKIQADHLINILLIGQDRRPGESRARSDAMILCTFNLKDNTLTMTSFLRDLYVKIPGYKDNRINAAYALGGMQLLDATLEQNFGVVVDGNVEVDFNEFEKIINLLGGVDINLTSAEANHMGLSAGWNHLDGSGALNYARIRKLDSDFGRTNRQRTVMTALIQAYRNKPLNEMISLLDVILPIVTTDMSNSEMLEILMEVFPILSGMSVSSQYIPASGTYTSTYIRGMAVLYPDIEANHKILVESLLKP